MNVKIPELALNWARGYPMLGLGTSTLISLLGGTDKINYAVKTAIDLGYRHFDCAYSYLNEKDIGNAIQEKIRSGVVKRQDLFITTKLYQTHHNPKNILENFNKSLQNLQSDYVDLYLMHWPLAFKDGDVIFPRSQDGKLIFADHDYVDTYQAMEKLVDLGLVKSLGLSNFNSKQIDRLISNCRIKPVNIQIESHPYMLNEKLVQFCKGRSMTITAFGPLGNKSRPWAKDDEPVLLNDPTLLSIAKAKNKTAAQVCLRFLIQRNIVVIPKSVNESRLKENMQIFDFELSDEEMEQISSLDKGMRFLKNKDAASHKYYPFHDEF